VVPAVNQIEVHPYFAQREVQDFARRARHPHRGLVTDRRPLLAVSSSGVRNLERLVALGYLVSSQRCQRPVCGPRWWPSKSPHSSLTVQLFLIRVPPFARACFIR
jgi:hypothetical protein